MRAVDISAALDEVTDKFAHAGIKAGWEALARVLEEQPGPAVMAELIARVEHPSPHLGACFALAGGALIERGAPAAALGRALVAPLTRTLVAAERCVRLALELEDDEAVEEGIQIGDAVLSPARMQQLVERDALAVDAYHSLQTWYRPAVAAWTRDLVVLREVQADATFRAALAPLVHETPAALWLARVTAVLFEAPFVVRLPELGERYAFTLSGCSDLGQLTVLLADALGEPLARVGVEPPPPPEVLAVMRGEGPQGLQASYASSLALYPLAAVDPASGMPRDGVHTWQSPGGTGSHSLPPDFLPSDVEVVDGVRTLVLVGPRAPDVLHLRRVLPAVRMFDALRGRVDGLRRLEG